MISKIKERLIEEIAQSGKTTIQIAKEVGVNPVMITQYKTTGKLPSLETFAKLCKALGASADYVLGLTDL